MKPRWLWRAKVGTQPGYVLAIKGHPRATSAPAIGQAIGFRVAWRRNDRERYRVPDHMPWESGTVTDILAGDSPGTVMLFIERT